MEKNEKNGVFSRVRSRWRSIFSKKAHPVKLRDCNRLTFERILSDPDEQIGTIVAQATVNSFELPNGSGIALVQETTVYDEDLSIEKPSKPTVARTGSTLSRRFRRLSSGDLNVIRRMTEEIEFDLKNVLYDDNEITGEPDTENGNDRACFKPGHEYPVDQQMLFLKQCIQKIDTRPPNMYYLTNGWSIDNFEALFKYMIRTSEDNIRDTMLSIEFRDVVISLNSLLEFIEDYASFKGVIVHKDYVYATVHSKTPSLERKLRGAIEQFIEIEPKIRQARISYTSTITISNPNTPHVAVSVRFDFQKPCIKKKGTKIRHMSVQVDQVTGHRALAPSSDIKRNERVVCELVEIPADEEPPAPRQPPTVTTIVTDREILIEEEDPPLLLSYHVDAVTGETLVDCDDMENDETDVTTDSTQDHEMHEFSEMFPLILELFEKAGIRDRDKDEVDCEIPSESMSRLARKVSILGGVKTSSDGCEDTRSMSSASSESEGLPSTDYDTDSGSDSSDSSDSTEDDGDDKEKNKEIKSESSDEKDEKEAEDSSKDS